MEHGSVLILNMLQSATQLTEHNDVPNIQLAYTIAAERSRTEHTFPITIEENHEFVMKLRMIKVKSY
jgi:hypothetical protein